MQSFKYAGEKMGEKYIFSSVNTLPWIWLFSVVLMWNAESTALEKENF